MTQVGRAGDIGSLDSEGLSGMPMRQNWGFKDSIQRWRLDKQMKSIRQWVGLLVLLSALCAMSAALAVPAFPGLIPIRDEATGETISGYLCGDEFFSYRTDAEGRVIVTDETGCLRYVSGTAAATRWAATSSRKMAIRPSAARP